MLMEAIVDLLMLAYLQSLNSMPTLKNKTCIIYLKNDYKATQLSLGVSNMENSYKIFINFNSKKFFMQKS